MSNANDLELCGYHRTINSLMNPLNVAIRDRKLDKAFLLAMDLERAAILLQRRLNEIKYPLSRTGETGPS